jgi:hypothetical protein
MEGCRPLPFAAPWPAWRVAASKKRGAPDVANRRPTTGCDARQVRPGANRAGSTQRRF